MFVYPTDEFEVSKILENMKNKKSTGEDGISNEMLKCCSPIIEPHIATMFNNCIEDGIFPDCFKTAKHHHIERVIAKTLEITAQRAF